MNKHTSPKALLRILILIVIASLFLYSFGSAEVSQLNLSRTSREELLQFMDEISSVIDLYHSTSSNLESELLGRVKTSVESYFDKKDISVSWPWFDYSYSRDGDLYTVSTHVEYRDSNNKKQEPNVYSELFSVDDNIQIYYLTIGNEAIIDSRNMLPNSIWDKEPEPIISTITGLNLTDYTTDELHSLLNQTTDELKRNHEPKSSVTDTIRSMTVTATEKYLSERDSTISWPWFDYTYTNDWDLYTFTAPVTVKSSAGKSDMDVYSEAYPINGQYTLTYLSIGDDIVLDNRELVNSDTDMSSSIDVSAVNSAVSGNNGISSSLDTDTEPVIMQLGSTGEDVRILQEYLHELGFLSGSADGNFGNKTKKAVLSFQKANKLTADGNVTQSLFDLIEQSITSVPEKVQRYTSVELYEQYKQNEVAADAELKGKTIEVSGTIYSIDSTSFLFSTTYTVLLYVDEWGINDVYCYFGEEKLNEVASLRKDQKVVIRGVCDGLGLFGDPELTKCEVIE